MKFYSLLVVMLTSLILTSCNSANTTEPTVEGSTETDAMQTESLKGEWRLSFDLPVGWFMKEIEAKDGVYLQNTEKEAWFSSGRAPEDYSEEKYATEDVAQVTVLYLDKSTIVPPAENYGVVDLGGGFVKVKTCDDVTYPECGLGGSSAYTYFLTTSTGEKFSFHSNLSSTTVQESEIEEIILSARE